MNPLKWWSGKRGEAGGDAAPSGPDAALYINRLLLRMVQEGFLSITLRAAEKLPAAGDIDPEGSRIDFHKVRNRLKVLSKLNPVDYSQPVSGDYEVTLDMPQGGTAGLTVRTQFFDKVSDPHLRISLDKPVLRGPAAFR